VPPSIQIPAGAVSANFTATAATAVTNDTTALITATYNGLPKTVTESLNAAVELSSLVCRPAVLAAQGTSTCRVTLNKAAPNAFTVAVVSNNSAVTVPASVTVAAGATAASFTAQAGTPSTLQTATITASAGGVSETATITVSPR
jgi:hypothetical protein